MKYWQMSTIAASPLLPPVYAVEVNHIYRRALSQGAINACCHIACQTEPYDTPALAIIESIGAPPRRVYTGYPECDEWLRLERGGVILGDDCIPHIVVDALH